MLVGAVDLGLVGVGYVENAEEGLVVFSISPVGGLAGFVPGVDVFEVVVFFVVVGAVVSGIAEIFGEAFDFGGEFYVASEVLCPEGRRVDAGDEAGA